MMICCSLVGCSRSDKVLNANIPTETKEVSQETET